MLLCSSVFRPCPLLIYIFLLCLRSYECAFKVHLKCFPLRLSHKKPTVEPVLPLTCCVLWITWGQNGNFHLQSKFFHLFNTLRLSCQNLPGSSGAPFSISSLLISSCPFSLAMYTGVVKLVFVLTSAPFSISSKTVSLSPFSTAAIKGSRSSWALILGSAPLSSKYLMIKVINRHKLL